MHLRSQCVHTACGGARGWGGCCSHARSGPKGRNPQRRRAVRPSRRLPPTRQVLLRPPARAAPTFGPRSQEDIMAQSLFRTVVFVMLTIALLGPSPSRAGDQDKLRPTISFSSSRDNSTVTPLPLLLAADIYLISPDGDNP